MKNSLKLHWYVAQYKTTAIFQSTKNNIAKEKRDNPTWTFLYF